MNYVVTELVVEQNGGVIYRGIHSSQPMQAWYDFANAGLELDFSSPMFATFRQVELVEVTP